MATPEVRGAYELLQRFLQQQGANACQIPGGTPAYDPDDHGSPQGGLLGRLQALDAARSPYQQPAGKDSDAQRMRPDPNFRQLTRVSPVNRAIDASPQSADQPSLTYPLAPGASTAPSNTAASGVDNPAPSRLPSVPGPLFNALSSLFGHQMAARKSKNEEDDEFDVDEALRTYWAGVEARARERANYIPSDPGNNCTERYDDEINACYERSPDYTHWDYLKACKSQAAKRLAYCAKKGGRSGPDEPRQWGEEMEEIYRNHSK